MSDFWSGVSIAIVAGAVLLLPRSWVLMILFGVVHAHVSEAVAPVGFWPCVPMAALLGFLGHVGAGEAS